MRLTLCILTALSTIILSCSCKETYFYEKQNLNDVGKRITPIQQMVLNIDKLEAHPATLPTTRSFNANLHTRFKTIYQGVRTQKDIRVFKRKFDYDAKGRPHHILCQGIVHCMISFFAVESTDATPVILKGGAGYTHFTVVVKAKAGRELKGQIRAYCKNKTTEVVPYTNKYINIPFKG